MGKFNILDRTGDVEVAWNPEVEEEVKVVKETFNDYIEKGFRAYRHWDNGKRGEELKQFDKYAEKVLFVPPLAPGDATLAQLR